VLFRTSFTTIWRREVHIGLKVDASVGETTASRKALGPIQPPIQWVPGALSLGVKRPGREADHYPPSSSEIKEWPELYLHSTNTPSWWCAWLKAQGHLYLYLYLYLYIHHVCHVCQGQWRQYASKCACVYDIWNVKNKIQDSSNCYQQYVMCTKLI
jgi:hypothetical protein